MLSRKHELLTWQLHDYLNAVHGDDQLVVS
jgi:hypothetical protein